MNLDVNILLQGYQAEITKLTQRAIEAEAVNRHLEAELEALKTEKDQEDAGKKAGRKE